MFSQELTLFGRFNQVDVRSVQDAGGDHWFPQNVVASALGVDRSTLSHMRSANPDEFSEGEEYKLFTFNGKRRLFYSEEGFLTACDLSTSNVARHLRKWMRQQFRVKHRGEEIVVRPKNSSDDFSDLGEDLVVIQRLLDSMAEGRRAQRQLKAAQQVLESSHNDLSEKVRAQENQIALWNESAKLKPGEMTAIQLAVHCKWRTCVSKGAHNLAVILAATNAGFREADLIQERRDEGYGELTYPVSVFTPVGVSRFLWEIDRRYHSGQSFTITPNETSLQHGYKCKRNVIKD